MQNKLLVVLSVCVAVLIGTLAYTVSEITKLQQTQELHHKLLVLYFKKVTNVQLDVFSIEGELVKLKK